MEGVERVSMVDSRLSGRVRSLGWHGGISVAGTLLAVFLFPKLAPVWLLQFVGGVSSALNPVFGHVLYCVGNREWIAGAMFTGGYIKEAIDRIDDEREFTEAERDAFEAFAADVASMSIPSGPSASPMVESNVTALSGGRSDTDRLRRVRSLYHETVMSVPGYDSVYGDGVDESLAAEFGDELAIAVVDGTQFTRPLRGMLTEQASTAARERERHLETLGVERRSVVDAGARLGEFDPLLERTNPRNIPQQSFEELLGYETDLGRATAECRQLLEDRQVEIHTENRRAGRRSDRASFQEYLYRPLETSFPVLSTALERLSTLRDRRRAVVRSIARRY